MHWKLTKTHGRQREHEKDEENMWKMKKIHEKERDVWKLKRTHE